MTNIDLHVHTSFSDGTLSPTQVVDLAVLKGLAAIAITDHDNIGGIKEAQAAAKRYDNTEHFIRIVPGVELSACYKDRDIHLLGLFIDHNNTELNDCLEEARQNRIRRNHMIAARFQEHGITIHLDELSSLGDLCSVTRAHFARYLTEHGYTTSANDAFDRYLGFNCPFYVPRQYITPHDAIQIITKAGGLPILAHPLLYHIEKPELEVLISQLADYGLRGLEAVYSANTGFDEQYVRGLANRFKLLISGGSDFHGENKPHISIGKGRGSLRVPETILITLENELKKMNH